MGCILPDPGPIRSDCFNLFGLLMAPGQWIYILVFEHVVLFRCGFGTVFPHDLVEE